METLKSHFQASDADGNGRLNQAEYAVFYNKIEEDEKQRGTYVDPFDNMVGRTY